MPEREWVLDLGERRRPLSLNGPRGNYTPEFSLPTIPVIDAPTGRPGRLYLVVRELAAVEVGS